MVFTLVQTLALIPAKSGYNITPKPEFWRTQLEGGAGRYGRGPRNAAWNGSFQFITDAEGFRYLRAFYRTTTLNGALPLLMQIVYPLSTLTTHKARFVPNSVKLTGINGETYVIAAAFEIEQRQR